MAARLGNTFSGVVEFSRSQSNDLDSILAHIVHKPCLKLSGDVKISCHRWKDVNRVVGMKVQYLILRREKFHSGQSKWKVSVRNRGIELALILAFIAHHIKNDHMSSSNELSKGDRFVVSGLVRAVHLNGRLGTVISVPKHQKAGTKANCIHYGIQIDGEEKGLAIKLSNLSLENEKKETPNFRTGDGLTTAKFNGRRGLVIEGPNPSNEDRYRVRMENGNQVLGIKADNIRLDVKTTRELEIERDQMRNATNITQDEAGDENVMASMRGFMNASLTEEAQIQLFGRCIEVVPDFVTELKLECGGFPDGVNPPWAEKHLRLSYELASTLPHFVELSASTSSALLTQSPFDNTLQAILLLRH